VAEPGLPAPPFALPALPQMRSYVLPEVGHVLVGRDFASQELRVMAHFEDGLVAQAYRDQPDLDLHQYVTDTLNQRGHVMTRRRAKSLHFAVLYGVGVGHLAELLECSVIEARAVLDAYYHEFPSVRALSNDTRQRWRQGLPVRTWGGRVYAPEPSRLVDGRVRGFEYKALNVIVQGSSADLTKAAMIAYAEVAGDAPLILTVHDELVATAPLDSHLAAMGRLRDAMNVDRLDVPMRSDGYVGVDWEHKTPLKDGPPTSSEPRPLDGPYVRPDGKSEHQPPLPK
jgi:DNA polymerase-1